VSESARHQRKTLARAARCFLSPWLLAVTALPIPLTVDPQPGPFFVATFEGPASGVGPGEFRGAVAWNGSPMEMPLIGTVETTGNGLRLRASLRYADVPRDWLLRLRPDSFDYRVRGEVGGAGQLSWSGTLRWEEVAVSGGRETLSRFVKLSSLELTDLSPRHSEGRAVLAVTNPFSFPISLGEVRYELRVNGEEVGGGRTRGRTLRAGKNNALELPFRVDHARFRTAAGSQWAVGAQLDAGLTASIAFRLPAGDRVAPIRLSGRMGTDGARSGASSFPEGSTSLSPR